MDTIYNTDQKLQLVRLLAFLYGNRASIKEVGEDRFEIHSKHGGWGSIRFTLPAPAEVLRVQLEHLTRCKIVTQLGELGGVTQRGLGAADELPPAPDLERGPSIDELIRRIREGRE